MYVLDPTFCLRFSSGSEENPARFCAFPAYFLPAEYICAREHSLQAYYLTIYCSSIPDRTQESWPIPSSSGPPGRFVVDCAFSTCTAFCTFVLPEPTMLCSCSCLAVLESWWHACLGQKAVLRASEALGTRQSKDYRESVMYAQLFVDSSLLYNMLQ